jgi:hypothetical protein
MSVSKVIAVAFTAILVVLLSSIMLAVLPISLGFFSKFAIVVLSASFVEWLFPVERVCAYMEQEFYFGGNDEIY